MQGASLVLTAYQSSLARAMDVIANNVANVNTTGYKRENIAFDTYLSRPTTTDSFQFSVDSGTYRDAAQGPTLMTGNPLDVTVQGKGYFQVQTEGGIRYTRAGAFQLNSDGEIVTASGEKVLGEGDQPIALPTDARDILIGPDGTISALSGAGGAAIQAGKLRVVKFIDEQALQPVGNNFYQTDQAPEPDPDSRVVQGAIEQSNVQSITEMTRMIDVSRSYQQVVRMLETEHDRMRNAIQRLGKITA